MGKFELSSDFVINDTLKPHIDENFRVSAAPGKALQIDPASGEPVYPKILATGSGNAVQDPFIFQKLIALTGKDRPNVVYIGTPFFDREDKYETGTHAFRKIGCSIKRLMVAKECTTPSNEEMRRVVIDWTDLIVVSGGNSLFAMLRWKSIGLDLLIHEAAIRGKVLCGGSAGCGCYFDSMQTDSLKPEACKLGEQVLANLSAEERLNWSFVRISCLGFIDAFCIPHIDTIGTNGTARVDTAKKMLLEAHQKRLLLEDEAASAQTTLIGLGVDEKAAVIYDGGKMSIYSAGPRATGVGEATCHILFLTSLNEVMCIPIIPNTGETVSLDELVERAMRSAMAVQSPLDLIVSKEVSDACHRRGCSAALDLDLVASVNDLGTSLLDSPPKESHEKLPPSDLTSSNKHPSTPTMPVQETETPVGIVAPSHLHGRSQSMDSFLEMLLLQPNTNILPEKSVTHHVRSKTHFNMKYHKNHVQVLESLQ